MQSAQAGGIPEYGAEEDTVLIVSVWLLIFLSATYY
jgi:hypothetical protein